MSVYPEESISNSSCWRDNISNFESRKCWNEVNTNLGLFVLELNRSLSAFIMISNLFVINALKLAFILCLKLFLYLGVVSLSEDDEEVPLLSLSLWDELVLLHVLKLWYSSCWRNNMSNFEFWNFWNEHNTNLVF